MSYFLLLVERVFTVPNNPPPITEIYCCNYGPVVETQLLLCPLRSLITETEWYYYVLLRRPKPSLWPISRTLLATDEFLFLSSDREIAFATDFLFLCTDIVIVYDTYKDGLQKSQFASKIQMSSWKKKIAIRICVSKLI